MTAFLYENAKNICRGTAECTVDISWILEQELSAGYWSRLLSFSLEFFTRETTQSIDDIVWECRDESKNGNRTDRRLPWRNRGESSDCTRVLQHVRF